MQTKIKIQPTFTHHVSTYEITFTLQNVKDENSLSKYGILTCLLKDVCKERISQCTKPAIQGIKKAI